MAINIKELIVNACLELLEDKHLDKITIKDILDKTGISRQTFYNHFLDKDDLIHYIYLSKIIPDYHDNNQELNFKDSLTKSFENMKKYHTFMKQACMMEGQNCLKDYIIEHCQSFDLKWHQSLYGEQPMPQALVFATKYHANASSAMTLSWILSDMPISCEEIAETINQLRGIGMDKLFEQGKGSNPYK